MCRTDARACRAVRTATSASPSTTVAFATIDSSIEIADLYPLTATPSAIMISSQCAPASSRPPSPSSSSSVQVSISDEGRHHLAEGSLEKRPDVLLERGAARGGVGRGRRIEVAQAVLLGAAGSLSPPARPTSRGLPVQPVALASRARMSSADALFLSANRAFMISRSRRDRRSVGGGGIRVTCYRRSMLLLHL